MAHVVGRIGEVDAEPHHRRLMADGIDSVQSRCDHLTIRHVAVDELGVRIEIVRRRGMRQGEQQVEHAHLVPGSTSRSAMWEPMNPAPPVTRTLMPRNLCDVTPPQTGFASAFLNL